MFSLFRLILISLSVLRILPSLATVLGVGPNARVNSWTYSGTGCPQGSASFQISENATVMGLEEFQPSIGPGVPASQRRKECAVTLDMSVDSGFRYRVNGQGTLLLGYIAFAQGWTLTFQSQYGFKNDAAKVWLPFVDLTKVGRLAD
jgi:hypothetical protein